MPHQYVSMGAELSPCGLYRYSLTRVWDPGISDHLGWVLLNPSTADAYRDDNTIRRVVSFSKACGYGGMEVVNLFAFRSRDPKALLEAADPIGPYDNEAIMRMVTNCESVVLGCGAGGPKGTMERLREVLVMLRPMTRPYLPQCLGITKEGFPQHPLFISGDTPFSDFKVR